MELSLHTHLFTEDNVKKAYISPVTSFLMSLSIVAGIFVAGLTNSRVLPAAKAQTPQHVTVDASEATLAGTAITAKGLVINGVATDAVLPGGIGISGSAVDTGCGLTALGFSATGGAVYSLGALTNGGAQTNGVYASGNVIGEEQPPAEDGGVYTSGNVAGGAQTNGVYASGNVTGGGQTTNGVYASGNVIGEEQPPAEDGGVYTSGNVAGGAQTNGVYASGNVTGGGQTTNGVYASGNVYVGDCLQVVGGVLSGNDIEIIGGVVTGSNLHVTGGYVTSVCGN